MLIRHAGIYRSRLREFSVKVNHVDVLTSVTLADMPVNMTALLHLGRAVRALDSRLLAALKLRVPLQVPRVYIALRASRARVPLDVALHVSTAAPPRAERLLFLVVKVLGLLHYHRAYALQAGLQLDHLRV